MAQEEVVVTESKVLVIKDDLKKNHVDDDKTTETTSPKTETITTSITNEQKALEELKSLLKSALANNEFSPPPPSVTGSTTVVVDPVTSDSTTVVAVVESESSESSTAVVAVVDSEEKTVVVEDDGAKTVEAIESTVIATAAEKTPDEISIWGVPILEDERTDAVLLKFLTARDFKPKEALAMIKNTVAWRKEFDVEKLLEEDLEVSEFDKVVFMSGVDREGHPVCYNALGEFQNKEIYDKAFGNKEKSQRFLRWRIQYLEKGIRELLDFSPAGVSTMVQVNDLKNSPGLMKHELRQALDILQNNYPEFVKKQVFINVPWWYLAFNRMISPFLTQRTKSKFVFAGPSKSAETLFSYISPEQVPVQFGGLRKENDSEFNTAAAVTEINIKPNSKEVIEIPVTEECNLVWELRVLGWDVTLGAQFVPSSEDGYTVIIEKTKKLTATDEPVAQNSFKIGEPGKVVLTIDNASSKKKLLYRYKLKDSTCDC